MNTEIKTLDLRFASAIVVRRSSRLSVDGQMQLPPGTPPLAIIQVDDIDAIVAASKDEARVARLMAVAKAAKAYREIQNSSCAGYPELTVAYRKDLDDALAALEAE